MKQFIIIVGLLFSFACPSFAAIEVAVVKATTPGSDTTMDFTSTGFGTPTGAIFFMSYSGTDGAEDARNFYYSVGFTDGTNQGVTGIGSDDGAATSNTGRGTFMNKLITRTNAGTGGASQYGTFNAWITDGVRIDWTNNSSFTLEVVCVLVKGVSVNVGSFAPHVTQNSAASVTGLAYEPDVILFAGAGQGTADDNTQGIMSFGMAYNGASIEQAAYLYFDEDAQGTSDVGARIETDSAMGQYFNSSLSWSGEVTAFNADGYTVTTRDGGSGGDAVVYMTISALGYSASIETLTSPTSTGTVKNTTSFQSGSIIGVMTEASAVDTASTLANFTTFGASDGAGEESIGGGSTDNVGTTDTHNITDAKAINVQERTASNTYADLLVATVSSYDSDGITLNYTTTDSTARKGFGLVIGAAAAGGGWAHKINGVTSPGKVNGVANANIGKINGVAA